MAKISLIGKKEDFTTEVLEAFKGQGMEIDFVQAPVQDTALIDTLTLGKKTAEDALAQVNTEKTALEATIAKYAKVATPEEIDALSAVMPLGKIVPFAKNGKALLEAKREECVRLYKAKTATKASEAMVANINASEGEALDAFLAEYGSGLYKEFGAKCNKCDSTEITFRKSKADGEEGEGDEVIPEANLAQKFRD